LKIAQRQPAQIVRSHLCLAARREERPRVRLEQPDPGRNVTSVAQIAVNRELGAQEGRA
jgi:hypothetical protein